MIQSNYLAKLPSIRTSNGNRFWLKYNVHSARILQPTLLFVSLGITSVRITPKFVPILYGPLKSPGHPMFLSHLYMEERECSFSLKVAFKGRCSRMDTSLGGALGVWGRGLHCCAKAPTSLWFLGVVIPMTPSTREINVHVLF